MKLYAALITLSLVWGLSFAFIKILVEAGAGPWGVVFLRCFFGVMVIGIIILILKNKVTFNGLPFRKLFVVGVMNAGLPWALIALSEQRIQSSTASILNATTPIWTSLIGFLLFGVVLAKRQWGGILLGFFGILVLMDFNLNALFQENFIGIGTMVLAAMCYGFSSQFTKRYLSSVQVLVVSFFTLVVGCLVGLIGMATMGHFPISAFSHPIPLTAAVGLGVFGSGLAYLLFFYMIKNGSPEFATFVTYLVPVTAMLWGYVLLEETLSPHLFIGLAFIFFGVYLSSKKKTVGQTREKENIA